MENCGDIYRCLVFGSIAVMKGGAPVEAHTFIQFGAAAECGQSCRDFSYFLPRHVTNTGAG